MKCKPLVVLMMMVPLVVTLLCVLLVQGALGKNLDPFIIGGREAAVGAWPWQGSLQYRNGAHTCGCVLISQSWILTAAHCVGAGKDSLMVYMGLHDRSNKNIGQPKVYYISSITVHGRYDQEDYFLGHDIALIKPQTQVQLNDYVKVITMADEGTDFTSSRCFMTGWGKTSSGSGGYLANKLQEAEVAVITQDKCDDYWYPLGDGQICCGVKGQKSSCSGDSGGPLVCEVNDEYGKYHLAGLTSYNLIGCGLSHPSVYTRVSYYRWWVKHFTGLCAKNDCSDM